MIQTKEYNNGIPLFPQYYIKDLFKKINEANESKHMELISSSILLSQVLLHYQEELKNMNSPYYKHEMKKYSKLLQKELLKAEEKEFDKVFDSDSEVTHQVLSNLMEGVNFISKNGFSNMMFHIKSEMVFKQDPKRIEKFVDKLLKDYNIAKK
tara:strand:+ start:38903 stop:39361 length:459 start_codon:yes stop_codon:yes gene_type:complete